MTIRILKSSDLTYGETLHYVTHITVTEKSTKVRIQPPRGDERIEEYPREEYYISIPLETDKAE